MLEPVHCFCIKIVDPFVQQLRECFRCANNTSCSITPQRNLCSQAHKHLATILRSLQDALATARRAVGTDTSSWLTPSATTAAASSNSGASAAAAAKATAAAQTIITAAHTLVHKELRKLDSIEAQRGQARAALMQCTERVAAATAAATAAGVAAAARVAEALRSAETAIQAVTEVRVTLNLVLFL
jgi:hypothetical protein